MARVEMYVCVCFVSVCMISHLFLPNYPEIDELMEIQVLKAI